MPSRREYLRLLTAGTTGTLAGCSLGRSQRYRFEEVGYEEGWEDYSAGGVAGESSEGGRFRLEPGEWTWRSVGASENEAEFGYEIDLTTGPSIEIFIIDENSLSEFRNRESRRYRSHAVITRKQSESMGLPSGEFTAVLDYTQFGSRGTGSVVAEGTFSWWAEDH